jgi:hypothetical protein
VADARCGNTHQLQQPPQNFPRLARPVLHFFKGDYFLSPSIKKLAIAAVHLRGAKRVDQVIKLLGKQEALPILPLGIVLMPISATLRLSIMVRRVERDGF